MCVSDVSVVVVVGVVREDEYMILRNGAHADMIYLPW